MTLFPNASTVTPGYAGTEVEVEIFGESGSIYLCTAE